MVEITVVNPAFSASSSGPGGHYSDALAGWAERQGLGEEDARDWAAYYENPSGWFGSPQRSQVAALREWSDKHGVPPEGVLEAVQNSWFGQTRAFRTNALRHWASRRGIEPNVASELAEFVERGWSTDPEAHRKASLISWQAKRKGRGYRNNPTRGVNMWDEAKELLTRQYIPDPAQEYIGIHGWTPDAGHVAGTVLGGVDSALIAGLTEIATKNEGLGTLAGFGGGMLLSKGVEAWDPWGAGEEAGRGHRAGTWFLTFVRILAWGLRKKAGVASNTALGAGLDDIVAKLKSGDILGGLKLPVMAGVGLDMSDLKAAFPKVEWPKLPWGGTKADEQRVTFNQGYGAEERITLMQGVGAQARGADSSSAREIPGMPYVNGLSVE